MAAADANEKSTEGMMAPSDGIAADRAESSSGSVNESDRTKAKV